MKGSQMNLDVNNNKFKAFKKTVGFFALASIGATALVYGTLFIPFQYIVYSVILGLFVTGFWMMYSVNLQQLENDEKFGRNKK
jgi:hypothetical protein